MSVNVPIIFDDSPFFEWGEMEHPKGRRNFDNFQSRRHPSLFEQWGDPFYEYPKRKQHQRPDVRRRNEKENENRSRFREEENRFSDEEGTEDDIYDSNKQRGAPKDNFGWDGWNIPVQFMGRSTTPHHKHKHSRHKPRNAPEDEKQDPKRAQLQENKTPTNTELANNVEEMEIKAERHSEKKREEDKMEQQSNDSQNTEASSEAIVSDPTDSNSVEIPITYSPNKSNRRHSKRVSQCDPPSPADIKLTRIKSIVEKMEGIEAKIAEFVDTTQNKNYLYISETLMKILLDLDTVDSEGFDNVRQARKEAVRTVQGLVDKLENKLEENKQNVKTE